MNSGERHESPLTDLEILEIILEKSNQSIKLLREKCRNDPCKRLEDGTRVAETEEDDKRMRGELHELTNMYNYENHIKKLIERVKKGDVDRPITIQDMFSDLSGDDMYATRNCF